jgi:hypothetical protein
MKKVILISFFLLCLFALHSLEYRLPKVLFITSGDGEGQGTVSDGVILALQEFNKSGAFVRLENRQILHYPAEMQKYSILIIPTTFGYHDADRRYSLSFLSNQEMQNISDWVKQGGILVSDVYLGRNKLNGEDRISAQSELNRNNWLLADCFGVNLQEKNMQQHRIISNSNEIWNGKITPVFDEPEWAPVVSEIINSQLEILAHWQNGNIDYPAITKNNFFAGKSILLATFNLIHPAGDGGFSNAKEIQAFYRYVYELALQNRKFAIDLNPWPKGAQSAFCLTFDVGGSLDQYQRIQSFVKQQKIQVTMFVTNNIDTAIKTWLEKQDHITLESNSQTRPDFRTLNYQQTVLELLENKSYYNKQFKGFRFPFTNNSFWGMKALDELGFVYDSSIAVNHLEFYRGSLFPYNIPIFKDGYYQSLDLLEISQNFHDDWYYFKGVLTNDVYDETNEKQDAAKYDAYLQTMWKRAIQPENGLMVFQGHPMYSGLSKTTMQPLENIVQTAKNDDAWITSIGEVASYWNQRKGLDIIVSELGNEVTMNFRITDNSTIEDLSFKLTRRPQKVIYGQKTQILENEAGIFIVLESVKNGDDITLKF